MVHLWTTDTTAGTFTDDRDYFSIANMNFAGWYKEEATPIQFIRENAMVWLALSGPELDILVTVVMLSIGPEHFLTFVWASEEIEGFPPGYLARSISHKVTVWPIEWHPIPG